MNVNVLLLTIIILPMVFAFLVYCAGRKSDRARDALAIAAVVLTLSLTFLLVLNGRAFDLRLVDWGAFALIFRADGFRALYALVTAFLWLITTIFAPQYLGRSPTCNRYWFFNLLTFGAIMGVFFSADFRTAFLFFEIMTFCSYALVAHNETSKTMKASETYLGAAIISGLIQLMGMALLFHRAGTLEFAVLHELFSDIGDKSQFYLPGILLLIGFGTKAGMYPLHVWLPKAYPAAPAPATALLSGILSKTGIFGLVAVTVNVFGADQRWGVILLIPAVVTMLFGAMLALFSDNFKRTLACSSISQMGFILVGVAMLSLSGDQIAFAASGTFTHMLNHSLFKLMLFLLAGVVFMNRRELKLVNIEGFGRGKPLFFFVFITAALGVTGIPLLCGYISKTMLKKSISDAAYLAQGLPLETLLNLSYNAMIFTGALTFAYMSKLFITLFVRKGNAETTDKKRYMSIPSAVALAATAALVPLLGIITPAIDNIAAMSLGFFHAEYSASVASPIPYFNWENIRGALISVVIGIGVYAVVALGFPRQRKAREDFSYSRFELENLLYRPLLSLLTLGVVLRPGRRLHTPGRFLSLYFMTVARRTRPLRQNAAIVGHFSMDLLLVGIGVSIAVVYVFLRAVVL